MWEYPKVAVQIRVQLCPHSVASGSLTVVVTRFLSLTTAMKHPQTAGWSGNIRVLSSRFVFPAGVSKIRTANCNVQYSPGGSFYPSPPPQESEPDQRAISGYLLPSSASGFLQARFNYRSSLSFSRYVAATLRIRITTNFSSIEILSKRSSISFTEMKTKRRSSYFAVAVSVWVPAVEIAEISDSDLVPRHVILLVRFLSVIYVSLHEIMMGACMYVYGWVIALTFIPNLAISPYPSQMPRLPNLNYSHIHQHLSGMAWSRRLLSSQIPTRAFRLFTSYQVNVPAYTYVYTPDYLRRLTRSITIHSTKRIAIQGTGNGIPDAGSTVQCADASRRRGLVQRAVVGGGAIWDAHVQALIRAVFFL